MVFLSWRRSIEGLYYSSIEQRNYAPARDYGKISHRYQCDPKRKKNGMGSGESDIKKTCAGACVVMRKNKSNIYEPDEKQMTYDD